MRKNPTFKRFLALVCCVLASMWAYAEQASSSKLTIQERIKADERIPTIEDLSGSWTLNPDLRGPSYHFVLDQKNSEIEGEGAFEGCLGTDVFRIKGYVDGDKLYLTLEEEEKEEKKLSFTIVEFRGAVGLSRDDVLQDYPMVSYNQRAKLKKSNQPNQAVDTTAVNARLFDDDTSKATNVDVEAMTGAAVVSP